jgi:hypothetical protein
VSNSLGSLIPFDSIVPPSGCDESEYGVDSEADEVFSILVLWRMVQGGDGNGR